MLIRTVFSFAVIVLVTLAVVGQQLPSKIRGYKVYNAKVSVAENDRKAASGVDAVIKLGDPEVESVGLAGVGLTVAGDMTSIGQTGTVDFLSFRDFRINGIPVEIEEYDHPFAFKERETTALPYPIKVTISPKSVAKAAFREVIESKEKWAVTGKVLVFGRFRKYGFTFKRVVPVSINIEIANPVKPFTNLVK